MKYLGRGQCIIFVARGGNYSGEINHKSSLLQSRFILDQFQSMHIIIRNIIKNIARSLAEHFMSPSSVWNIVVDPVHGGTEDLVLRINPENQSITTIVLFIIDQRCSWGLEWVASPWPYPLPMLECYNKSRFDLRYSLDMNWQRRSVSISKNSSSPATDKQWILI